MRLIFFLLLLPSLLFAAPQKNVLLITIDTLRADHLGCYGDRAAKTPNLDALARRSMVFEKAVSQAPLTLPSHTSLMTGLYPFHHGVHDNAGTVNPTSSTLAEILRQNGYHTYAFVGGFPLDHRFGLNQGFDVYNDLFQREKNQSLDFRNERSADAVLNAVLTTRIETPYFLWVHFYDPHAPYLHGGYDGEIHFVDEQIGKLLAAFGQSPAIIAVAGDHGESLGEHGEWTHRIFLYDATVHVPFFIYQQGHAPQRIRKQVRLVDFLPTLLSDLKLPSPRGVDGAILPQGAGVPSYMETFFPQLELGWSPLVAIRTDEWKYIQAPKPELYSLTTDPKETKNLISTKRSIADKLRALLPQSTQTATQSSSSTISPEMQEQLASLGYVSGAQDSPRSAGIDPKDRIGIWNQIELAVDLEKTKPQASLAILEKARRSDPQNPMLLSFLAQKYGETNQLEQAKEILLQTIETSPKNPLALYRLATISLKAGNPADAAKWSTSLLQIEPQNPDALILLARARIDQGNFRDASVVLERALQIDPADSSLRVDLGNVYLQSEKTDDAITQFQLILIHEPHNLQALNGLATAYYNQHDLDRSEAVLLRALRISAQDVQTKMNLALVYATEGKAEQAIRLYREVIESRNTPADWKAEAQSRLKELE